LLNSLEVQCSQKELEILKKEAVLARINGHLAVVNGQLADRWIDVIDGDNVDAPAVPFRLLGRFPMKKGKDTNSSGRSSVYSIEGQPYSFVTKLPADFQMRWE
jgi:hypothetical protein